jgi:hypothetical protein
VEVLLVQGSWRRRWRPVIAILSLTTLVIIAGCAASGDVEDLSNATSLIASAESRTPLPPGSHFDASGFVTQSGVSYQSGWFLSVAESEAQCKWYGYWLQGFNADDTTQMDAAQATFKLMDSWPLYTDDPQTGQYFDSLEQKAELGDPTGLQQFISANCGGFTN